MVMLAVQSLGQTRPLCFARTTLFAAQRSLDAGNVTTAGVKLLKASRLYLDAMCIAHDIKPAKSSRRVIRQLLKAGGINKGMDEWLAEIVKTGTHCANCEPIQLNVVEGCISFLHFILDNSPEVDFPTRDGGAL